MQRWLVHHPRSPASHDAAQQHRAIRPSRRPPCRRARDQRAGAGRCHRGRLARPAQLSLQDPAPLAQAGVLRSGRGPRGGFRLARAAREITLGDIAAPFGEVSERKCLLGRATCGWKNPCSAHPRWEAVSAAQQSSFARRRWPICWARSPISRAWRPATTSRRTSNARRRAAPPPTSRARRNAVPPLPENASGSRCTTLSTHEVSRVRPCSCA
jgi:hypothetical protein